MGSTSGRFLLGLLLGLVCGGGLAHWLGGSAPPKIEELGVLVPGEDNVTLQEPREERNLSTPALGPKDSRPVPASARIGDGEVRALVASVGELRVAQQSGNGVIHGRVTGDDGQGIQGVVVRLTRSSERSGGAPGSSVGSAPPEHKGLEQVVREAALRHKRAQAARRELMTNETGHYRFDTLEDTEWAALAYLEGYKISSETSSSRVKTGTELDFTAVPVVEIPIMVFTPTGAAADLATVNVQRKGTDDRAVRFKWTGEEAFVRLVPGKYEISAYSGGTSALRDAEYTSEPQEVVVEAGVEPTSLRFNLRGRLGIRGYVKTVKGDPKIEYVMVRMMPLGPQQEPDLSALAGSDETAFAQPGREFSFMDLEPGRYLVGVSRSWSSPITVHRIVDVANDMVRCDLELPAIDRARLLRVIVEASDGEALDDVDFYYQVKHSTGSTGSGANTVRDEDGAYLIQFDEEHGGMYFDGTDSSVTFTLVVTQEKHGQRELELDLGQTELSVTFGVPGTLVVTVAGYQGSGYEGRLNVSVQSRGKGPGMLSRNNRGSLGAQGQQEIPGLDPGAYTITLNASPEGSGSRRFGSTMIDSVDVDILPGPNAVSLRIPTLYSLRVHWADGKSGANLSMTLEGGEDRFGRGSTSASLNEDGVAEFKELRAGDYLLRSWAGTAQQMRVTVPGKDVEFVPMHIDAMRVVISDETGDLAKLGFRDGDLIIGADGKEFEDSPDFRLIGKLQTSKSAKLTFIIDRGGKRLEITATGADMGDWSDLGGQLVPTQR